MKRKILADAVDLATLGNIVIFDSQAKAGEFTIRLADLLYEHIIGLTGVIVSETTPIPNGVQLAYRHLAIFRMADHDHVQLLKYYDHLLGGSLASGDKHFGLAINHRFDFTLFSY